MPPNTYTPELGCIYYSGSTETPMNYRAHVMRDTRFDRKRINGGNAFPTADEAMRHGIHMNCLPVFHIMRTILAFGEEAIPEDFGKKGR